LKRRIITNDEQDVHTPWRRMFTWTQRAGATAKVKRRTRRRERRDGRCAVDAILAGLPEEYDDPGNDPWGGASLDAGDQYEERA
jgi:hypothetical protein